MVEQLRTSVGFGSCEPSIPGDRPSSIEYDPKEFPGLAVYADGANTYAKVEVKRENVKQVKIDTKFYVSEEGLKDSVEIESSGDKDKGLHTYKVKSPKVLLPSKCIRVEVVVTIPESVTDMEELQVGLISGDLDLGKDVEEIRFQSFVFKAINSDFRPEPTVKSENTVVEVVHGSIEGVFHAESAQVKVVNGDICGKFDVQKLEVAVANGNIKACVKVDPEEESSVTAKTVRGDIKLRVTEDFQGSFRLANFVGDTHVKGHDVELEVDKDHQKTGKHISGDEDDVSERSSIKLEAISGDLTLVFD